MKNLCALIGISFFAATSAWAQGAAAPVEAAPVVGQVEFGGRVSRITGDSARYERYRDLRNGPTLDRFRYERKHDTWEFLARVDHAGYRDQRYVAEFKQYGKLKADFTWDEVPFFYANSTQAVTTSPSPGVFRLNDGLQLALQNRATTGATTALYSADLRRFDLRSQRSTARAALDYRATRTLDLRWSLTSTDRTGSQPWGVSFGQSNAIEVAAPVDRRSNDMNATAEWSNQRAMARLAYDGSWFNNRVESLIVDNPLALTDQLSAPGQARLAGWPDSTAHTVSAAGAVSLPARTRAFAYVSIGSWLQDQAILPFTINTAIAPLPLARPTAEAEARIVSMNYRLTSRPTPKLWLSGQVKSYDYENRTPRFLEQQYVGVDGALVTSATGGSEPFGYVRHFLDLDASYAVVPFAALRVGYGRQQDDRTFRLFEQTTEQTARVALDSTGLTWGSMRVQYEHGERKGKGLDEEVLSDIGEQTSLRQFDISDRRRDRVQGLIQVAPTAAVGLNASVGVGREQRPGVVFGLQDNDVRTVSVGIDATKSDVAVIGGQYTFERYTTYQRSRQANPGPQFDDPTRDWSTSGRERVHTMTGSLELPHVAPKTVARIAYDVMRANGEYLYDLTANTTLVRPQPLAPVTNEIQRATADVRYTTSRHVGLAASYWFERYAAQDFARSPGTLDSPFFPALINLMYQNRPYRAHTISARIVYFW